jgi:glycosyltransferase involved in cell wall biosynthesis
MSVLVWVMLALSIALLASALDVVWGVGRLQRLERVAPREAAGAPLVSLIVAARNEARGIEAAARSRLAQRYPASEIIAVDDRSTDATGEILERLSASDARLRVVHVRELPPGWLGKNHALSVGAATARGAWLLFTDADVVMQPETLARAIGLAERSQLDHVAALPHFQMRGLLLHAFITYFVCWGLMILRPWKVRDPRSRRSAGVGAFNLVRATAYAKAGGHAPIRLRPDDDLKLGKILKRSGARSEVVIGAELISVEWYHSLREVIDGLMKNSFSLVDYHTVLMLGGIPLYLGLGLGPLGGLLFGGGALQWLGGAAVAVQLGFLLWGTRETRVPRRSALLFPLISVLFAWILLRALVLNLAQGGIVWRGTFYPLSELRRNKV